MRSLITMLFIMVFSINTFCQTSYTLLYTGPQTKHELEKILNENKSAVIAALSDDTKKSLETYMVFAEGRVAGFSGTDANIANLWSTNMKEVLEKILDAKVRIHDSPAIRDYDVVITRVPGGGAPRGICSFCTNCAPPSSFPIGCCSVGGSGCCDIINPNLPVGYKE